MRDVSLQTSLALVSVESVNARHWPSARAARRFARRLLHPAEVGLIARHRDQLSGNVLELGSTGDRLTAALVHESLSLTGLGSSTPTVDLCRSLHPTAKFLERDLRDLDSFEEGQFNAVVAGRRTIDRLGDHQRRYLLDKLRRIVADDGVLIFSSHNLGCESLVPPPARNLTAHPFRMLNRLARMPRALRNRAHLSHLQEREYGYAILNGPLDDYAFLRYYVSRDAQERQLAQHSFALMECVELDDAAVPPGDLAYGCHELHYAARPASR